MKYSIFSLMLLFFLSCQPDQEDVKFERSCNCIENDSISKLRAEWITKNFTEKAKNSVDNFEWAATLAEQLEKTSEELFCPTQKLIWVGSSQRNVYCACLNEGDYLFEVCHPNKK